jgi:hypothetical protein
MAEPATELRSRIAALFEEDPDQPPSDDRFNSLARDVFAFQFEHNPPYAAYCRRRGITPHTSSHWSEIPPVPTGAFKEVPLVAGDPASAQAVFQTSGTTRGAERRGRHYILDLQLYEQAVLPNFRAHLLPDQARLPFLSLIPSARQIPDSSLAHMVEVVTNQLALTGASFMDATHGLRESALEEALAQYSADGVPVCLLGTSFAFVHWLDSLASRNRSFCLTAGSRIMDTGGFKGRSRSVPESELRAAYRDRLGVSEAWCVNEYGMTELCSQFYNDAVRNTVRGLSVAPHNIKRPPPWVKTQVVDPETLRPVPAGEHGILQHFDLANLYSVVAIQTEDLGRVVEDGFELLGRAPGATPRGCSVAVDLLLEAVRQSGR